MKSQAVIFLTVLGVVALFSNVNAVPKITPQYIQSLIQSQEPCLLFSGFCDKLGRALKIQLPILLKDCTFDGCDKADERIKAIANIVRKTNAEIWEMIIIKYGPQYRESAAIGKSLN